MPPENNSQLPSGVPMNTAQHRKLMGILSYLGILVVIPLILAKDDPFVKFHIKQGLVLLIVDILAWFVLSSFLWQLWMLAQLINLGIFILDIMGIVHVIQGKEQELPLIGSLARSLPL